MCSARLCGKGEKRQTQTNIHRDKHVMSGPICKESVSLYKRLTGVKEEKRERLHTITSTPEVHNEPVTHWAHQAKLAEPPFLHHTADLSVTVNQISGLFRRHVEDRLATQTQHFAFYLSLEFFLCRCACMSKMPVVLEGGNGPQFIGLEHREVAIQEAEQGLNEIVVLSLHNFDEFFSDEDQSRRYDLGAERVKFLRVLRLELEGFGEHFNPRVEERLYPKTFWFHVNHPAPRDRGR